MLHRLDNIMIVGLYNQLLHETACNTELLTAFCNSILLQSTRSKTLNGILLELELNYMWRLHIPIVIEIRFISITAFQ